MKYQHILSEFNQTIWGILPAKFAVIRSFLLLKAEGGEVTPEEIALIKQSQREPRYLDAEERILSAEEIAKDFAVELDKQKTFFAASPDNRMTAGAAGYMELEGAAKDNDCRIVNVPGGVSTELGCCNEFDPLDGANEFECGQCENVVTPEVQPTGKTSGVLIQAATPQAADPNAASRSRAGAIAVLPLTGTISHRVGLMSEASGGTSTEKFTGWLRAAVKDPSVKAIVIDCDSPGGGVDGVPELGDEIFKARQQKPVIGIANSVSASAAYWLLSQCSELVVTPSGQVGSIGVFATHEDISKAAEMEGVKVSTISAGKYKTEANAFEPLSDEARQALQSQVNTFYDMFTKAVGRGRNTSQAQVKSGYGEGRMVMAQDAVKAGMADRVATMDQTLSRLGATGGIQKQKMAAAAEELRILPVAELPGDDKTLADCKNAFPHGEFPAEPSIPKEPDYRIAQEQRERELELYR